MPILPPFIDLLAFDAAARHGTFTRAARDLNVSQPAVSRRVASLETDLGVLLFSRDTKPLRLTPDGEQLFGVLRSGLSRLEATVEEIRSHAAGGTITISAGPGFASFWLIPRLPLLQSAFPDHHLRIMSGDHPDDAAQGDLQVRFGDGTWPGVEVDKILGEDVFAVCSPIYLEGRPAPLSLAELKASRLLRLSGDTPRWYGWRTWFEALGSPLGGEVRTLEFDSYALVASAALAGQGIALCWDGLLDQMLDNGALVRASAASVRSSRGYFVTCARTLAPDSAVRKVAQWLAKTAAARS